jgi:hypothetical protein
MHDKTRLALLLGMLGALGQPALPELAPKERDKRPRKFTDARIAAAQAKRERKAARRRGKESSDAQ